MAKILSIEDDPDIQHLIGQMLFREGYEIHYAWNGKEGYEKILKLDPDLLLLDLMLPIMNGVELLEKLRSNKVTQNLPIIIVTSYGDEADMLKQATGVLGAAGYLRKPVQATELIQVVKQTLALFPRAQQQMPNSKSRELRKGCIRADVKFLTVWIDDRFIVELPPKEFALLQGLIETTGSTKREALLKKLGYKSNQMDALKQVVHRLRHSLGSAHEHRIKVTPDGYELIG